MTSRREGSPVLPVAAPGPGTIAERLEDEARRLGFLRMGIAEAGPATSHDRFRAWIEAGSHGTMDWLARGSDDRADIRRFLPGARSVVVVSAAHDPGEEAGPVPGGGPVGRIARYARSKDYHKGVKRALVALARRCDRLVAGSSSRIFLDTTPVLEREWAARAGLGWIGKNGCLIDPEHGSWLLLGGFATTALLPPGPGPVADGCGDCRRCLDGCPTSAFRGPRDLDARRCLSYVTIEHRGPLDRERLLSIGERIFGCDACQEVCPWNEPRPGRSTPVHPALRRREAMAEWPLAEAARLTPEEWNREFAGTAVRRPGFAGFARSVAGALASQGARGDLPALDRLERVAGGDPGLLGAIAVARDEISRRDRGEPA